MTKETYSRLKFTPLEFETNVSDFCIWRKAEA